MFSRQLACVLTLLAGGTVLVSAPPARAGTTTDQGLQILSQSVRFDFARADAIFSLTFDHAPDFTTLDRDDRRQDSFQYEIAPGFTDISQATFFDIAAVVRGDEISSRQLPVRAGVNGAIDPDPAAGGWGPKLGSVDYTLQQNRLTFSTPLQWLGAPDGLFAYRVFTTEFGSTVTLDTGSTAVPLPPAVWAGGAMVLMIYLRPRGTGRRRGSLLLPMPF